MNDFKFYLPFDVQKSENKDDNRMIIGGYASTADCDRQEDIIIQKGIDYDDFIEYGWINYNHDNSIICGWPIKEGCKIDSKGFYIKAELLPGVQQAEDMYKASLALQAVNAPRRMGFSVEGKILSRDKEGRVTRCKIANVAITSMPVNTNCTWEALTKSMTAALSDWDKQCNLDGNSPIIDTNPVIPESLEGKVHDLTDSSFVVDGKAYSILRNTTWFNELSDIIVNERVNELAKVIQDGTKSLTDEQMILFLQLTRGISRSDAEDIVKIYHLSVG